VQAWGAISGVQVPAIDKNLSIEQNFFIDKNLSIEQNFFIDKNLSMKLIISYRLRHDYRINSGARGSRSHEFIFLLDFRF
jgi:hypothetical protein